MTIREVERRCAALSGAIWRMRSTALFFICGVETVCTVESRGYLITELHTIPQEETLTEEREFHLIFSVEIVP